MKRHAALIPLSHDHQHGLAQALRLRRAAAKADAPTQLASATEFVTFYKSEQRVHLRDEEEQLFPLLLSHLPSEPALLQQARLQHTQLQGLARKLEIAVAAGIVDPETLATTGTLLEAHIRLEERQLFPMIEELVPERELQSLEFTDRNTSCVSAT